MHSLVGRGAYLVEECCRHQLEVLVFIACLGRRTFLFLSEHDHRTNGGYIKPNDSTARTYPVVGEYGRAELGHGRATLGQHFAVELSLWRMWHGDKGLREKCDVMCRVRTCS